ncbi:hypothetical protein [uncultured Thermanaerothrix sp.]|uniref:hypothetical protein n=1 Tax=uncultured Thermanaerothrix sp. TaxID=1195149 RepID=UPI0026158600|nr:hypothetical protein [uncultured Thermanaerothrix sp.]
MVEKQPKRFSPISIRQHQKQVLAQIYLPIALALLLIVILPIAALIFTPSPLGVVSGQWAAIALIWLMGPFFVLILFGIVISVALIVVFYRLMVNLPNWTQWLLTGVQRVRDIVKIWGDRSVQPVLSVYGIIAAWQRAVGLLWQFVEAIRRFD